MKFFKKKGFVFPLEKDRWETEENFNKRGIFVASQIPKTKEEYKKTVLYSRLYMNKKILGCVYDKNIMDELDKMEKNMLEE